MQPLNTINPLNSPDLSGNSPQIHECYWFVFQKKKLENLLFSESDVIVQSSLKCPALSVCAV